MKDYFKKISEDEKKVLLSAPVYAAGLAVLKEGKIRKREEEDAINLAHLRTFTAVPILRDYYIEVEKSFEDDLKELEKVLLDNAENAEEFLKSELSLIRPILKKMDEEFAEELSRSLKSFSEHVAESKGLLEEWLHYFILPLHPEYSLGNIKVQNKRV